MRAAGLVPLFIKSLMVTSITILPPRVAGATLSVRRAGRGVVLAPLAGADHGQSIESVHILLVERPDGHGVCSGIVLRRFESDRAALILAGRRAGSC